MRAMNEEIDGVNSRNRKFGKFENQSVSDSDNDQNFDDTFFQTSELRKSKRRHKSVKVIDPI